mmetsp:Transcript_19462/g.48033  ORF Transcript_19462/g.48033 Transcript_19462/m.48033 type:complete len:278 (-) Transcript_19462:153-986(-)
MPRMMFLKSKQRKMTEVSLQNVKATKLESSSAHEGSVKTVTKIKKNKNKALKIFRRTKRSSSAKSNQYAGVMEEDTPQIERGLTWTNSEDSSCLLDLDDNSIYSNGSTQNNDILELPAGNSTLLIPVMSDNDSNNNNIHKSPPTMDLEFLMTKHKNEIEEKQVEIEVMQDQIALLNGKNEEKNRTIDSIKEQHKLAIHEKIMEMKSMQSRMVIMKNLHGEEIEILESTIQEKEDEIIDLKARLNCTKADLFEVSSSLIQTQHKLHDLSTAWPYKFFA